MRTKSGNKEKDILNAAVAVFAQEGYYDAKIHSIAEVAGIATGTVYLYFGNKENILLKIFETVWENLFHLLESVYSNNALSSIEKFNKMFDSVFEYFVDNPSLIKVFVNEQNQIIKKTRKKFTIHYQKTIEIIETLVDEGKRNGAFGSHVNPVLFSQFFFGGFRHLLHEWAEDQKRYNLDDIHRDIKRIVLNGIAG